MVKSLTVCIPLYDIEEGFVWLKVGAQRETWSSCLGPSPPPDAACCQFSVGTQHAGLWGSRARSGWCCLQRERRLSLVKQVGSLSLVSNSLWCQVLQAVMHSPSGCLPLCCLFVTVCPGTQHWFGERGHHWWCTDCSFHMFSMYSFKICIFVSLSKINVVF